MLGRRMRAGGARVAVSRSQEERVHMPRVRVAAVQASYVLMDQQATLGLPRVFRTGELMLFHAASCRFRYSSWASCGVL
jgi:hypothetical protein